MESYQYCVAMGNPFDGVVLHGPFLTADEATEWAESQRLSNTDLWIVTITEPTKAVQS